MSRLYEGVAVGVTFEPNATNLQNAYNNRHTNFTLEHVPTNTYDINAIAVMARGKRIGWIPKPHNKAILQYGMGMVHCTFDGWTSFTPTDRVSKVERAY